MAARTSWQAFRWSTSIPQHRGGVGIVADDREAVEWEGCRLGSAGLAT
ncbi:hypothetical protein RLEG3_03375 (plasmid) [Rhizobium leguminosarum bv. trifolii WSM1689]|nr:hypothetical protein RLEG3_03375 [Rhizobium leguminosarum bv. trifolii WSM1689]